MSSPLYLITEDSEIMDTHKCFLEYFSICRMKALYYVQTTGMMPVYWRDKGKYANNYQLDTNSQRYKL